MRFSRGDILSVQNEGYVVVGGVTYRNMADGNCWDEYRLRKLEGSAEAWLSIDDVFREYSITMVTGSIRPSLSGYHIVDQGREVVVDTIGSVDVVRGDAAAFAEYEDVTEELIISEERWDDGPEYSKGHYVDWEEICYIRHDDSAAEASEKMSKKEVRLVSAFIILVFMVPFLGAMLGFLVNNIHVSQSISHYLKKAGKDSLMQYSYVTSITGASGQKADVYKAGPSYTIDFVAEDIITAIEGDTEYVQKDEEAGDGEEGSVAILTKKEYCLVYPSEDNEVLVQVSNRKYAYTDDSYPYRSRRHGRRYYRRFYYSTGYSSDSSSYSKKYSSPYSSFDDTSINYSGSNSFNTYSGTVRQNSINSRRSDGGGLSSGK